MMDVENNVTKEDSTDRPGGSVRWRLVVLLIMGLLLVDAGVAGLVARTGSRDGIRLVFGNEPSGSVDAVDRVRPHARSVSVFVLALGVTAWARTLRHGDAFNLDNLSRLTSAFLLEAFLVCLGALVLRSTRVQLLPVATKPWPGRTRIVSSRQFSLGSLMAWITVCRSRLGTPQSRA